MNARPVPSVPPVLRRLQSEIESIIACRCISSESTARVPLQVEHLPAQAMPLSNGLSWARQPVPRPAGCPAGFPERRPALGSGDVVDPISHRLSSIAPAAWCRTCIGRKYPMQVWQYYDHKSRHARTPLREGPPITRDDVAREPSWSA